MFFYDHLLWSWRFFSTVSCSAFGSEIYHTFFLLCIDEIASFFALLPSSRVCFPEGEFVSGVRKADAFLRNFFLKVLPLRRSFPVSRSGGFYFEPPPPVITVSTVGLIPFVDRRAVGFWEPFVYCGGSFLLPFFRLVKPKLAGCLSCEVFFFCRHVRAPSVHLENMLAGFSFRERPPDLSLPIRRGDPFKVRSPISRGFLFFLFGIEQFSTWRNKCPHHTSPLRGGFDPPQVFFPDVE